MRHKLGIAILAALMALAGTREAYQQFAGLKDSVADWTRTSILGNLLVSAAGSDGAAPDSPAAQQQPVVLLAAQTRPPCPFARVRAASQPSQTSRAVNASDASTEHARFAARQGVAAGDWIAASLDAARAKSGKAEAKARERMLVKSVPQIAELSKLLGDGAEIKWETDASRAVEGAARARAESELKKLGVRRVFVRVSREEKGTAPHAPAAFEPHTFADVFTFRSVTGLGQASDLPAAPGEASHDAPADDKLSDATSQGFDAERDCHAPVQSLDCDGDPLG